MRVHIVHEHTEEAVEVVLGRRHIQHAGQAMAVGKGGVLLAGFEQEGKLGELLGAGVEVDAREVVAKDVFDGFGAAVAFGHVELEEQVEALVEDVARTAGEVSDLEFLKVGVIYN